MFCFICNLHCDDENKNMTAIFISDGITKKNAFTYKDMLTKFLCDQYKFKVHISETDIICKTCQNLIECYDIFYYETKICQELLMRQLYRNYKIPKNEQHLSLNLLDYDVAAASSLYSNENEIMKFKCKECEYKTKYTDTLASHYKFHKFSSEYIQENLQNSLQSSISSTSYNTIKPKITLTVPTTRPTIEINDDNITYDCKASTATDSNHYNFEFINVGDDNNDHKHNLKLDTLQCEQNIPNEQSEISDIEEIDEDMDFLTEELPSDLFNKTMLSNKFVCSNCNKYFLSKSKLDAHVKLHCEQFSCCSCEYISKGKQVMEKHIRENHLSTLDYCDICDVKTSIAPCEHTYTIKRYNKNFCKLCRRSFQTFDNFTKHSILLHLNCFECNKQFESKEIATKHIYYFHAGLGIFNCRGCRKSFETQKEKKMHICNGTFTLKCKLCSKTINTITLFRKHMDAHASKALYVCYECGQTFRHLATYNLHMKYHSNPKPYKCKICKMSLASQSGLKNHVRRHKGELKYKCDYCDKKFVTLTLKKRHESVHTGNYRYNCNDCIKGFNRRYLYATHLRIVHNDYSVKKLECQYKLIIPKRSLASSVQMSAI